VLVIVQSKGAIHPRCRALPSAVPHIAVYRRPSSSAHTVVSGPGCFHIMWRTLATYPGRVHVVVVQSLSPVDGAGPIKAKANHRARCVTLSLHIDVLLVPSCAPQAHRTAHRIPPVAAGIAASALLASAS